MIQKEYAILVQTHESCYEYVDGNKTDNSIIFVASTPVIAKFSATTIIDDSVYFVEYNGRTYGVFGKYIHMPDAWTLRVSNTPTFDTLLNGPIISSSYDLDVIKKVVLEQYHDDIDLSIDNMVTYARSGTLYQFMYHVSGDLFLSVIRLL